MTGAVTWEVIGVIAVVLAGAGSIVGWVLNRFSLRDKKIDKIKDELSEHKLYAAEHYATKTGLTVSLNRVHDSFDNLTGRIDELLRELSAK